MTGVDEQVHSMQCSAQKRPISGNPHHPAFSDSLRIKVKEGLDPEPFIIFTKFLRARNIVWRPRAARISGGPEAGLSGKGHSTLLPARKRRITEEQLCGWDSSPSKAKNGRHSSHPITLEQPDYEQSIVSEEPLPPVVWRDADKIIFYASPVVVLKDVFREELMLHSSYYKPSTGSSFRMELAKKGSSASAVVSTFAGQETEHTWQQKWPPHGLDPEPFVVIAKFLQERNMI